MKGSKELKLAFANAIVEKLWLKGLLTETQKNNIIAKNSLKIFA